MPVPSPRKAKAMDRMHVVCDRCVHDADMYRCVHDRDVRSAASDHDSRGVCVAIRW